MCGIAAIVSISPEKRIDPASIRSMTSVMGHRGPDGEGYFVRPNLAFGHKRLSIIDLEGGKQPMSTQDKRFTIVFNGEIFNYKAQQEEMRKNGSTLRTNSDTEVVLLGFQKHGSAFFDRLEGMFAGLIYDALENRVTAFRDSFGIKPLYVCKTVDTVYFASEIKAIRKVSGSKFHMHEPSLFSYYMLGYAPGKQTMMQEVQRLGPGNVLEIDADGKISETPFSTKLIPGRLRSLEPKNKNALREELVSSVQRSMVSDVPVGLYLSGGVDSSLIAAITKKELNRTLQSFCISFPQDPGFDESAHAREVAQALGIPMEVIPVHPEQLHDVASLAAILEEPMLDPSAMALMKLSESVRPKLKVVLSGEGGDELFGGYHRYFWSGFARKYAQLPDSFQAIAEGMVGFFPSQKKRLQRLLEVKSLPKDRAYFQLFSSFDAGELEHLAAVSGRQAFDRFSSDIFSYSEALPDPFQAQWIDMVTFLRDGLLVKADKMSMRNSVEVRVPFLQTDIAEAAFSLPKEQRCGFARTKPALRSMLQRHLPARTVERKKQGFEFPLGRWFSTSWKDLVDEYVSREAIEARPWISKEVVEKVKREHYEQGKDRGRALFSMVMLEAWAREFLDS